MEKIIKIKVCKSKWIMPIGFAIALLLFALSIALCVLRGFVGMDARWVFNIGTDVVSIAICTVVYFGCMMDSNGVNENTALFTTLVLVNAFALFFDEFSWILQGVAPYAFWNRLVNAVLYANGSIVIYLFWCYVTNTLEIALNLADAAPPRELLDAVRLDVDRFVGDAVQFDDLTMLCLRYQGP